MNLFYDEGWKRERETFAASGRGKDKTGFWQRKRGPKMKKKLFYLCYTPAVLSLGILYCFLYRTGVSNQTGFYVGDNFLLPVFYLSGLFLLAGLYLWSVRSAAKSEGPSAEGNSFLWGVSSILCGVLLLLRALNEVRQLAEPFLGQESVPVKNIILPGLDGILSLAAALSFVVLGIRLLNQNLHLYRYSLGLLWIVFWSAFRLVVRFGQLPMAFRMPQRLLEVLLMTAQCLFFLEGSHILCNVIGQKSYRRALFSGHAAAAIGLIWCICPLMAGDLSFSDLSQMLDYSLEWGIILFVSSFSFFITPPNSKIQSTLS